MSVFFNLISVDEAIILMKKISPPMESEVVSLMDACDRVLAGDVVSDIDIPGFDRSWKDGYAVVSSDCINATDAQPTMLAIRGRITMGSGERLSMKTGEAIYIPTGGQMPLGADAVIMVEHTEEVRDRVLIKRPASVGENVILKDEDFSRGEVVFRVGRRLSPQDIGVLAAVGASSVSVRRKPRVGVISTGIEIVPVDTVPAIGEVRDVNSYLCGAYVQKHGGIVADYGIVRDDVEAMKALLHEAASECDLVLISGGSSKDKHDVTAAAMEDVGEVLAHGIAIAPGKPTVIGRIRGVTPVVGIPGHPAGVVMILNVVVRHLFAVMVGHSSALAQSRNAILFQNIPSEKGREDYVRIHLNDDGMAVPLFGKSGLLNTIAESEGVIKIPAGCEGLEAGEIVEVMLW
jgi:molybdopterin molybdotransferase